MRGSKGPAPHAQVVALACNSNPSVAFEHVPLLCPECTPRAVLAGFAYAASVPPELEILRAPEIGCAAKQLYCPIWLVGHGIISIIISLSVSISISSCVPAIRLIGDS